MSHVDRVKSALRVNIVCEGGRRRSELIAAVFEVIDALKVVFLFFIELAGAVILIKPDHSDRAGVVVNDTFGDTEVATAGLSSGEAFDFSFDGDFAGANVADMAGHLIIGVISGEGVN